MLDAIKKFNKALNKVGGTAEGHFKVFRTKNEETGETRTNLFLKADKLPFEPAVTISLNLPGDSDDLVVSGFNALKDATGLGNAPEDSPPSN